MTKIPYSYYERPFAELDLEDHRALREMVEDFIGQPVGDVEDITQIRMKRTNGAEAFLSWTHLGVSCNYYSNGLNVHVQGTGHVEAEFWYQQLIRAIRFGFTVVDARVEA